MWMKNKMVDEEFMDEEGHMEMEKGKKSSEMAAEAMEELMQTVAKLRAPQGCPWDRAQTHESLKAACVEEAAEVVSGINILSETGRAQSLMEELGDLLLQVVMHAQIAEEEGLFTMEDVIRGINRKMIRRHPHVFGQESLKKPNTSPSEPKEETKHSIPCRAMCECISS